jgi:hypothetical protein
VLAVPRLVYLRSQKNRLAHSTLSYALLALKAVAALFVVASTIASLVYSRNLPILSSSLGLAAPIIQIITAVRPTRLVLFAKNLSSTQVLLTFLVSVEHFKSITPSTLVLTYAFIKGLFSAVIMRSSIQIGSPNTSTVLLALVTAAYLLQTLFELVGKRRALIDKAIYLVRILFDIDSSVSPRAYLESRLPASFRVLCTCGYSHSCGTVGRPDSRSTTAVRYPMNWVPMQAQHLFAIFWSRSRAS